jgi:two-component system nitrogen regulation response regulator NtrX
MAAILIVDDEAGVRGSLGAVLRDEGYGVDVVDSGEACLETVTQRDYDVILLDIWLPGIDGLATLERLRERRTDAQVVMISGHASVEAAVRATKLGAFDFIEKPLSLEKTVLVVRNAVAQRRLEVENRALRARVGGPLVLVGASEPMVRLRDQISMAAPSNGRVMISGENGTGKELVARQIHAQSHRRAAPFIEVNCAAIPEELIESELFGHVRGAFTGAVADRRGKFEAANGGTLFLDEVGDMSLKTQAKVLRALQEQVVEPVGGRGSVRTDVRVIAATNKSLTEEIRQGRFREDLFFRLNVIPIFVPPLRERGDDVLRLAEHFIAEFAREYGRRPKTFSAGGVAALRAYRWPGNVRELRNTIERLMIGARRHGSASTWRFSNCRGACAAADARRGGPALRGTRRLGARLHHGRVDCARRKYFADGRHAGTRAQQSLQEDAHAGHRAARPRRAGVRWTSFF